MFSQWNSIFLQAPQIIPSKRKMVRNVVAKAYVEDSEEIEGLIFHYTDSLGSVIAQEDIYFNVPQGRLKLRISSPNPNGQLIYYQRPNIAGPKVSDSRLTEVEDVLCLKKTLSLALGELGVVQKRRRVYVKDNVHIHLDEVKGIGCFIEFSVALDDMDTDEKGIEQAMRVMEVLQIEKSSLVSVAYLDLLMQNHETDKHII
uniref:CYTH domain-containing protein n=1 Tax=Plectus sambesii TaxID=2011161 RepID=A0A914WHH2_9BILA